VFRQTVRQWFRRKCFKYVRETDLDHSERADDHGDDGPPADVLDVSWVEGPAGLVDDDHAVELGVWVGAEGADAQVVGSSQHSDP